MNKELKSPETLQEAIKYFSDADRAHSIIVARRWPNGVACPRCGTMDPTFLAKYYRWQCKGCKKQFTVKVGTIFEDSPLKLETWLTGMWLVANAKNGISSYEIHRALGITQKSAWFLLHRVRLAMQRGHFEKLSGTVEADETFVGGKEKNRALKKRNDPKRVVPGKAVVMGLLERHSKTIRTKHVRSNSAKYLQETVRDNVEAGSELQTDAWRGYKGLSKDYVHRAVNHVEAYVKDGVHTNGLESYWNLFKRCYKGTWTHLSDEHLHRYLIEQEYRFNSKGGNDQDRFFAILSQLTDKRLTYAELIS